MQKAMADKEHRSLMLTIWKIRDSKLTYSKFLLLFN